MALTSMQLIEFTDRSLLGVLTDVANGDGQATAEAIAAKLGIQHPHPTACVRQRLVWLKRYGMVDSFVQKGEDTLWGMTPRGLALYTGRLKAAQERALQNLDDGGVWIAASIVTRSYDTLDDSTAHMVRRDFAHHQQRRRLLASQPR